MHEVTSWDASAGLVLPQKMPVSRKTALSMVNQGVGSGSALLALPKTLM